MSGRRFTGIVPVAIVSAQSIWTLKSGSGLPRCSGHKVQVRWVSLHDKGITRTKAGCTLGDQLTCSARAETAIIIARAKNAIQQPPESFAVVTVCWTNDPGGLFIAVPKGLSGPDGTKTGTV